MKRAKRGDGEPFGALARDTLMNPKLSLRAKGMLAFLYALPPQWKFSIPGLRKYCQEGRDAIHATLKELQEAGYLHVMSIRDPSGKMAGCDYFFRETLRVTFPKPAQPHPEKPDTVKPKTAKPKAGKSGTGTPDAVLPGMEMPETDKPAPESPDTEPREPDLTALYRIKETRMTIDKKEEDKYPILKDKMFASFWLQYLECDLGRALSLSDREDALTELSRYPAEVARLIVEHSISKGWSRPFYPNSAESIYDNWKKGGQKSVGDQNEELLSRLKKKYAGKP